jgi:flagellin
MPVQIEVLASAKTAQLDFRASQVNSSVTLEIMGSEGVSILRFTSGTNASAIAAAVNGLSDTTGVKAELLNSANAASGIAFRSVGYGTKNFVSVQALPGSGSFSTVLSTGTSATRATGADAVATANGAVATGDGLDIRINTGTLDFDLTLDQAFGIGTTSFTITGGGAKFQLGPVVNSNQQAHVGIQSVAASKLGDSDVGYLADIVTGGSASLVAGKAANASMVIERAIRQVAVLRGRLGAFEKNTIETNANSLAIALENVTASESSIRDADFAAETSALTRAQILTQAGTSVLATANTTPQSVLSLLQR